jgi:hypothetical protein
MPSIDESQIKGIVSAAKDASATRDVRRKYSRLREVARFERSPMAANRHAIQNLVRSSLAKAGFETDRFEQLRAKHHTELARFVEEQKVDATKRAASMKNGLRNGIESWHTAMESLPNSGPPRGHAGPPPQYVLLNSPTAIWPTPGVSLQSSHVEPWKSWAKFTVHSTESYSLEQMSFFFSWENPSDRYAVIDVDTYLVLNGFCLAGSDGGFFPGSRSSLLSVQARLYLYELWNEPPTPPGWENEVALTLSTSTGDFFDVGAIEFEEIFRTLNVSLNTRTVPPHGVALFEVTTAIESQVSDGNIDVDFASGDFEVLYPGVVLTLLT